MTENNTYLTGITKYHHINEIVFIGLVLMCFIGDIIGEASVHASVLYWLLMVPVCFVSSLIIEKSRTLKKVKNNHFKFIAITWISAFFSIILVLFLWHSGSFIAESVGIIVHIILAHTLFIMGIVLGLRFFLLGLFLFILAGLTIAMEAMVGMTLLLSIPILLIGLIFKNKPTAKTNFTFNNY